MWGGGIKATIFPFKGVITELNENILPYVAIKRNVEEIISDGVGKIVTANTLGIHIRGTDMFTDKSHPNPYTVDEIIDYLYKTELHKKFDLIFLCSDDENIVNKMKDTFGNKVFTLSAFRATSNIIEGIHRQKVCEQQEGRRYKLGLDVMKDVYFLSRCSTLVCSHSNVAYAAMCYNNNQYERLIVWEEGSFKEYGKNYRELYL